MNRLTDHEADWLEIIERTGDVMTARRDLPYEALAPLLEERSPFRKQMVSKVWSGRYELTPAGRLAPGQLRSESC